MTDITELAQEARINAECGEHLSPAETMELVEALESEKRICATWRKTAEANSENLEKAQQRIAELESRTVTVKPMRPGHITVGGEKIGIYMRDEVDEFIAALTAAGIKVEAE